MSTHAKKYIIAGLILLAVIVIVGALYVTGVRFRNPIVVLPQSGQVITNTAGQKTQGLFANPSFNSLQDVADGTATDQISYQDALRTYAGRVIEFDKNCRAYPIVMQIAPKSVIMFANNSAYQRLVSLGERNYSIMPYNYVLASFNDVATYNVSCDSFQNVAVVSIK
jgi:hypothetical protein